MSIRTPTSNLQYPTSNLRSTSSKHPPTCRGDEGASSSRINLSAGPSWEGPLLCPEERKEGLQGRGHKGLKGGRRTTGKMR